GRRNDTAAGVSRRRTAEVLTVTACLCRSLRDAGEEDVAERARRAVDSRRGRRTFAVDRRTGGQSDVLEIPRRRRPRGFNAGGLSRAGLLVGTARTDPP